MRFRGIDLHTSGLRPLRSTSLLRQKAITTGSHHGAEGWATIPGHRTVVRMHFPRNDCTSCSHTAGLRVLSLFLLPIRKSSCNLDFPLSNAHGPVSMMSHLTRLVAQMSVSVRPLPLPCMAYHKAHLAQFPIWSQQTQRTMAAHGD
jgi:hypothetical protein